jgi:hypothetical protein
MRFLLTGASGSSGLGASFRPIWLLELLIANCGNSNPSDKIYTHIKAVSTYVSAKRLLWWFLKVGVVPLTCPQLYYASFRCVPVVGVIAAGSCW